MHLFDDEAYKAAKTVCKIHNLLAPQKTVALWRNEDSVEVGFAHDFLKFCLEFSIRAQPKVDRYSGHVFRKQFRFKLGFCDYLLKLYKCVKMDKTS